MVDAAKVRDDKVPAGQILFEQFWVPDCHLPFALDREARCNPSLLEHDLCHSDGIYDETDARSGLISFGRSRAFEFENPTKPTNASNTSSRKVSRLSLSSDF